METIKDFSYAGSLWPQECHFCHTKRSVKYWATIGPKTVVPVCNKCIALYIENKTDI